MLETFEILREYSFRPPEKFKEFLGHLHFLKNSENNEKSDIIQAFLQYSFSPEEKEKLIDKKKKEYEAGHPEMFYVNLKPILTKAEKGTEPILETNPKQVF